jgi:lipoate-protein ligase A
MYYKKLIKKEITQNIRSRTGPNMESEHFLQKVIIKQKLLTIHRKKLDNSKKRNKENLQNPIKPRQYRTLLLNTLKNTADQQEINQEWKNIERAITESAKKQFTYKKVS